MDSANERERAQIKHDVIEAAKAHVKEFGGDFRDVLSAKCVAMIDGRKYRHYVTSEAAGGWKIALVDRV